MRGYGLPRYKQLDLIGYFYSPREFAVKSFGCKCPKVKECIGNCRKCVKRKDLHSTKRSTRSKRQIRQLQKGKARAINKRMVLQELQNIGE